MRGGTGGEGEVAFVIASLIPVVAGMCSFGTLTVKGRIIHILYFITATTVHGVCVLTILVWIPEWNISSSQRCYATLERIAKDQRTNFLLLRMLLVNI